MKTYQTRMEFEVRDYECDLAGIVNNANYLHYLEHARSSFSKTVGLDFAVWAARGFYFAVMRVEIDYLFPLRSGDRFFVGTNLERLSPLRLGSTQDLYRLPDDKPIARAKVVLTVINAQGYPQLPPEMDELFNQVGVFAKA